MAAPLTDDYVASILRREAQNNNNTNNRYLSSTLGSLLSNTRSRAHNAPKPNTRFLKNIVRDADAHNTALRKKEEEESKARLRRMKHAARRSEKRRPSLERYSDRQRTRREGLSPLEKRERPRPRDKDRCRSRSRSPRRRDEDRSKDRRRKRERDSPRRKDPVRESHKKHVEDREHFTSRTGESEIDDHSYSDPLEGMIGPKAPSKIAPRGRGAYKSSAMDSRFDPNYNPKTDVGLEADEDFEDDWDMALEALRDRTKWRKSGADRLRAAGFSEEEVEKWEKGGSSQGGEEKDISDVRWRKKGEGREWDRGKEVDGGRVDVKASWIRRD